VTGEGLVANTAAKRLIGHFVAAHYQVFPWIVSGRSLQSGGVATGGSRGRAPPRGRLGEHSGGHGSCGGSLLVLRERMVPMELRPTVPYNYMVNRPAQSGRPVTVNVGQRETRQESEDGGW